MNETTYDIQQQTADNQITGNDGPEDAEMTGSKNGPAGAGPEDSWATNAKVTWTNNVVLT